MEYNKENTARLTSMEIFHRYYQDKLCWFWDYAKKYKKVLGLCANYRPCFSIGDKRIFYDMISDEWWDFCLPYTGNITVEEYISKVNEKGYVLNEEELNKECSDKAGKK